MKLWETWVRRRLWSPGPAGVALRAVARAGRWLTAQPERRVLGALAALLGVAMIVNHWIDRDAHLKRADYDWQLRHRIRPPVPDPSIVILDIDEPSLASMNATHGRWPWPRDVLAAVVADLHAQGAAAVVFDILFADRDALSPTADEAFVTALEAAPRTYFAVGRLDPHLDARSQVRLAQLPGLVRVDRVDAGERTVALLLPWFDAIVRSGRLGTINVQPDADQVVRSYPLWEEFPGARLWSLPARLAIDQGWALPPVRTPLLRYPEGSRAFARVSFADYYQDTQRRERQRPRDEFRDRIVVIGASAPALFDLKSTPVARVQPGVEILATAIDNLKRQRFIIEPAFGWYAALGLALLVACLLAALHWRRRRLELAFVGVPFVIMAVSYATLNLEGWYLDLTVAASASFLFFSAQKLLDAETRRRWSGERWYAPDPQALRGLAGALLRIDPGALAPRPERRVQAACASHCPLALCLPMPAGALGWLGEGLPEVWCIAWPLGGEGDLGAARDQAGALARALGVADSDWTFASTPLRDEPVGDPAACRQALIDALARAPRTGRPAEEMR